MKNIVITRSIIAFFVAAMTLGFTSCNQPASQQDETSMAKVVGDQHITMEEVLDVQQAWGEGIVRIGRVYLEDGDYEKAAIDHVNRFYAYDHGLVLFKPTLASEMQFRMDFDGALSYFVGGNDNYPEDHGFAIKPWDSVRWESAGVKIIGDVALAMGNYYFMPHGGSEEVKVEYSFAYRKHDDGTLKIVLHGSHVPYSN
jgi:hypothetical protein